MNAKLQTFDRQNLKALRNEITEALKSVAEKYGIQIEAAGASFSPAAATMKIQLSTITEGGQVITPEAVAFKSLATLYGLKAEDLGAKFQYGGRTYTIEGLRTKSRTAPITAKRDDGKQFKFPAEIVALYMKGAAK